MSTPVLRRNRVCYGFSAVRIFPRLVALCAIVALVVTCTAGDPFGSPDDPDDEAAFALHLSPALPPVHPEPDVILTVTATASVGAQLPVHGRVAELDIFRPPRARA